MSLKCKGVQLWRERRGDLSARILALLLAIALWLVASPDAPSGPAAPVPTPDSVAKRVEVRNLPEDHTVVGAVPQVEMLLTVPAALRENVDHRVVPYVDAAGAEWSGRTGRFAVRVERPGGVQLLTVRPGVVELKIDRVVTSGFPVQLGILGVPADTAVEAGEPEPGRVIVRGPSSQVDRVTLVVATIPFSPSLAAGSVQVIVRALDAQGERVEDVELSPQRVSVRLERSMRQEAGDTPEKGSSKNQVGNAGNLAR